MSKVRRVALSAGLVLAVGAAVAIPSSAAPTSKARSAGDHPHGPSPALRSMLREIDAHRIQSDITKLVGFGTRHTLSSQTDPNRGIGAARDWIFDQIQGYAAASGGRMTVREAELRPAARPRAIPMPVTVTNVVATLQRHAGRVGRPRLRGQRPLRLALHRRPELHLRRARRRRRRLGRGRRARARAGHGHAPVRRHDRLHGRRGRGAGPLRLDLLRRSRPRRPGMDVAGHVHQRHHRQLDERQGPARPVHACGCSPRACPTDRDAGAGRPAPVDRRRERRAARASSRATSRRSARTRPPACTCG